MEREVAHLMPECDEFAPGAVRHALAQLSELGWMIGDAMLVASELVTNAVVHSMCGEGERLRVAMYQGEAHLRISVVDPGASGKTATVAEDPGAWGGLGLLVVDQLAARWGSKHRADGYEVWAELALPETG
jgi:anti-sigma regulatory factor (Ser/Thr protein kinase)